MNYKNHIIIWNKYYNLHKKNVSWGFNKWDSHVKDFMDFYGVLDWKNKQVLDTWCWYWKNAIFFIEKWFFYTWIDIAKEPIDYARKSILGGNFLLWDIISYNFNSKFNFIVDAWCFHVNNKLDWKKILLKYREILVDDWLIFIRIFKSETKNEEPLFFVDNELPVWWYTESELIVLVWDLFNIEKIILDKDYYEEDEVFYLYLRKK